jgi:putative colanic acid biosysnthesis UDP-glucose lipid carrier transferase
MPFKFYQGNMIGKRYSKYLRAIFLFCDLFMLNAALFLGYLIVFRKLDQFTSDTNILLFILFNLLWIMMSEYFRLYQLQRFMKSENIIVKLAKTTAVTFLLVFAIVFTLKFYLVSRYMIYYTFEIFFILAVLFRILLIPLISWYRKAGYNYRNLIIIGAGPVAVEVMHALSTDLSIGLRILGFFDDHPEKSNVRNRILGTIHDAREYAVKNHVDEIIVVLPEIEKKTIYDLVKFADNNLIRISIVPDFYRYFSHKFHIDFFGSIPFLSVRSEPLQSLKNRLLKRGFDFIFSSLVILLIFPWLLPVIAILIKMGSRGPVFFYQDRSGLNNKVFRMIKFRTMFVNDQADSLQASQNDPRITRIGRFLRRTNLDEFPQFFNVWLGEMSVVGPRPHMLKHTEVYSRIIDSFMVRQIVKPGMTGWAQVTGFRGETGKPELMAKRVKQDVWYIENWSFLLDMKVVGITIINMLTGDKNAG